MDEKSLLEFIARAHGNTYAAPKEIKFLYSCKIPILEKHKDYDFTDGDWRYHDSYAGSIWAPGREVVFYKGEPVWSMAYQGKTIDGLSEELVDETFTFLKTALINADERMPFRGPRAFAKGDFDYRFLMTGDYRYFTGEEAIAYKRTIIFTQNVMGILVK